MLMSGGCSVQDMKMAMLIGQLGSDQTRPSPETEGEDKKSNRIFDGAVQCLGL
jgi:hypothetical protein